MSRRLALVGIAGVSVGSLAMAAGNYAREGVDPLLVTTAVVGLAAGGVLAAALRDEAMLTFEDPAMNPVVARWAPISMALLGTLVLLTGLAVLGYALA